MDSPRTFVEALTTAQWWAEHPDATAPTESGDWAGYCQAFVRTTYAIPSLFGSAWLQWLGADPEDRHQGGDPEDAPVGSALCYKGSGVNGHIMLAARPFPSNADGAWSNDLVRYGDINKVLRTAPTTAWGQTYLGFLTAVNDYDLQLKKAKPPKPKQNKRYESVDKAAQRLEHALETAKRQHDQHDVETLKAEIARLHRIYSRLRRY